MRSYSRDIRKQVRKLRALGKTFSEIRELLNINFPKSTLSSMCVGVNLPRNYFDKIRQLNHQYLSDALKGAWMKNKIKRQNYLKSVDNKNEPAALMINDNNIAKIALSILCLGEASKYGKGKSFYIGNSDPKIIILFLSWLKKCFDFKIEKVRCTVQCRADQNVSSLETYWQKITGVPKVNFYMTRVDPRTVGKPTENQNYKGVLRIDYLDIGVQLELESLAKLIYNRVSGPVVKWHHETMA